MALISTFECKLNKLIESNRPPVNLQARKGCGLVGQAAPLAIGPREP